jgi:hypothetical protein
MLVSREDANRYFGVVGGSHPSLLSSSSTCLLL